LPSSALLQLLDHVAVAERRGVVQNVHVEVPIFHVYITHFFFHSLVSRRICKLGLKQIFERCTTPLAGTWNLLLMNRLSFSLVVVLGVLLWYIQLPAQQLIRKAGGFASKTICSAVFVSER
jgi:hypothetical protein